MAELMFLGSWGSKTLIFNFCVGMIHLHLHWVSSIRLSGLHHGMRFGVQLHFGRYVHWPSFTALVFIVLIQKFGILLNLNCPVFIGCRDFTVCRLILGGWRITLHW